MNKREVQKRVLQNGKQLPLYKFEWDYKTKTFSTKEDGLVIDFKYIDNCTFNTGSNCVFKTGYYCTFKTGSNCTFDTGSNCVFKTGYYCTFKTGYNCTFDTGSHCNFDTGSNCTFDTGYNCTFNTYSDCTFNTYSDCVVIRRDIFEVIKLKENVNTQLLPYGKKGYLEDGYLNGDRSKGKYIVADGILSKIISKKGDVYKVINDGYYNETYLLKSGDLYAHGKTIAECRDSMIYKVSDRDTSEYKKMTLDTVLSKEDAIKMYIVITGSCSLGTKSFVDSNDIPDSLTIKEAIKITKGQWGNETLIKFFKK